jgi:pimeloyl-ACP methyl ester carboxylesterase
MPYFNHDGLSFYFEEHGSGIPLLFSHGLCGSLNQAKELIGSSTGFRLIVYDSRGHGKTGQAGDIDQLISQQWPLTLQCCSIYCR